MIRPNYFEILEGLSKIASEAVQIACSERSKDSRPLRDTPRAHLCELREECDRMICTLEDALFHDFVPPLQRDNIASLSHGFWRVVSRATEHYCTARTVGHENEEEQLCIVLSQKLAESTAMLRHIKSPEKTPSLTEFRTLLRRAGEAHNAYVARINSGRLPHSCEIRALSCARLRYDISQSFDGLVEVMLGNI